MESLDITHEFVGEMGASKFKYWVLRLDNQVLIHISEMNAATFDELAVSMPGGLVSTTILGTEMDGNGSQQLALKIAKRLNKQVFISCNVVEDRLSRPIMEKILVDEIKSHPEHF